jgi:hypothetical protein
MLNENSPAELWTEQYKQTAACEIVTAISNAHFPNYLMVDDKLYDRYLAECAMTGHQLPRVQSRPFDECRAITCHIRGDRVTTYVYPRSSSEALGTSGHAASFSYPLE